MRGGAKGRPGQAIESNPVTDLNAVASINADFFQTQMLSMALVFKSGSLYVPRLVSLPSPSGLLASLPAVIFGFLLTVLPRRGRYLLLLLGNNRKSYTLYSTSFASVLESL